VVVGTPLGQGRGYYRLRLTCQDGFSLGDTKWIYDTDVLLGFSPVVGDDGTIYTGTWGLDFLAINPDGSLKWSFEVGDDIEASPSIRADGTVYIGSFDNKLYAINPDGNNKWSTSIPMVDEINPPAIGADGTVYISTLPSVLVAIDAEGNIKWELDLNDIRDCHSINPPTIDMDGTIYISCLNRFYALNQDGSEYWKYQTGAAIKSSPTISPEGIIYFGSGDEYLYALIGGSPLSSDAP
jgi:outer membrane protein assembly factor BamB